VIQFDNPIQNIEVLAVYHLGIVLSASCFKLEIRIWNLATKSLNLAPVYWGKNVSYSITKSIPYRCLYIHRCKWI